MLIFYYYFNSSEILFLPERFLPCRSVLFHSHTSDTRPPLLILIQQQRHSFFPPLGFLVLHSLFIYLLFRLSFSLFLQSTSFLLLVPINNGLRLWQLSPSLLTFEH